MEGNLPMKKSLHFFLFSTNFLIFVMFFASPGSAMALPENTLYGRLISLTINPPSVTIQTGTVRTTKPWIDGTTIFEDTTGKRVTPNEFSVGFGGKDIAIVHNDANFVIRMYPLGS